MGLTLYLFPFVTHLGNDIHHTIEFLNVLFRSNHTPPWPLHEESVHSRNIIPPDMISIHHLVHKPTSEIRHINSVINFFFQDISYCGAFGVFVMAFVEVCHQ